MIDRRKIAWVLLALGALLAVVASLQDTFSTVYKGFGTDLTSTSNLWTTTSDPQNGPVDQPALFAAGWPVVVTAIGMAVAVVLLARRETAFAGRPLAVGAAGALTGVVLLYAVQLNGLAKLVTETQNGTPTSDELRYGEGYYLLLVAALVGLVGAVLAQRRDREPVADDEDEPEDGVVVHQLDGDDDTPPFGLALPQHDALSQHDQNDLNDEQREVR
ncbi:hypothetical protein [Lentzea sp. NPDC003310]|uniref:hypothetical protein n=1 Tax=Lentzea sp. NPDC003310 TaxID=3154447 RepID=UPI0033A5B4CC